MTEPARPALRPAKPTGALGKQRQEATKDKTDPSAQILDQTEWVRQDSPSSAANPTFGLPPALKQSKTKPLCSYFILPFIHHPILYTCCFHFRAVFIPTGTCASAHTHTQCELASFFLFSTIILVAFDFIILVLIFFMMIMMDRKVLGNQVVSRYSFMVCI